MTRSMYTKTTQSNPMQTLKGKKKTNASKILMLDR